MIVSLSHITRGQWALIILSLLLLARLGFALAPDDPQDKGLESVSGVEASDPEQPAAVSQLPDVPPLEDFSVIDERPLFMETRRPPEGGGSPSQADGTFEIGGYLLQGVVESDAGSWALLRRKGQQETLRVSVGDRVGGWEIGEIGTDYIELTKEGKGEYLLLKETAVP